MHTQLVEPAENTHWPEKASLANDELVTKSISGGPYVYTSVARKMLADHITALHESEDAFPGSAAIHSKAVAGYICSVISITAKQSEDIGCSLERHQQEDLATILATDAISMAHKLDFPLDRFFTTLSESLRQHPSIAISLSADSLETASLFRTI